MHKMNKSKSNQKSLQSVSSVSFFGGLTVAVLIGGMTFSSISKAQTSAESSTSSSSVSASSNAESSPPASAPVPQSTLKTKAPYDVVAPTFGPVTIKAAVTSQDTSGRAFDYDSPKGRRLRLKNEYSVTALHTSGWGLTGMAVTNGTQYGEDRLHSNNFNPGDPSLTVIHPTIYQDRDLKLSGQLRKYFPVTDRSVNRAQNQYAYYLYANYTLPKGLSVFNQLTPRYFQQATYLPADSKYFVEDYTSITKQVSSWFKYGIGQHSQIEAHDQTSVGQSVELYPLADFVLTSNIYIEPRLYFPILSVNSVYDAPTAVSLSNTQAEIFIRMAM
jgi:hypothetical protein